MADIRHATTADNAELRGLLRQLHSEQQANSTTLPVIRQESQTFVATNAEQIVGLAVVTFVDFGVEAYGMIEELVVDEAHRGTGIGRKLLAECQAWFDVRDTVVVFVSAATEDVVGFYQSVGFDRCTGPWLARARNSRTRTIDVDKEER